MLTRLTRAAVFSVLFLQGILPAQPGDVYASRRERLMKALEGEIGILTSSTQSGRLNRHFLYLTGLRDTGATLVLLPGEKVKEVLFTPAGQWEYAARCSTAQVRNVRELVPFLSRAIGSGGEAFVSFSSLGGLARMGPSLSGASELKNINPLIAELRALKDTSEIQNLKNACEATAAALNDAFRAAHPGLMENDLAATIRSGMTGRGSSGESFLQAASGPNSTNVHFGATERVMQSGDLVLFDVGCYWKDYTSDISRTIPVSGKFSKEQKEIYQIVLDAEKAGMTLVRPGEKMSAAQRRAEDVLIRGLARLGLLTDTASSWQRKFYIQHGFGHFIGLDVHDVWYDYRPRDSARTYAPGMVLTFEPGLYFPPGMLDSIPARIAGSVTEAEFRAFAAAIRPVYQKYANTGVRIEDDLLVTGSGNLMLTDGVPREIADIERRMAEKSPKH